MAVLLFLQVIEEGWVGLPFQLRNPNVEPYF